MDALGKLRRFNEQVRTLDSDLAQEALDSARTEVLEANTPGAADRGGLELESIVMKTQRPVLAIRDDDAVLAFQDLGDSEVWKARLTKARPFLHDVFKAVGRIELQGGAYDWIGTGWLIGQSIVVTNRHVAQEFAMRDGDGFVFSMGETAPIRANVDFLQEIDNDRRLVFKLVRPLFIQEAPGPDVAFFEIEVRSGNDTLAQPIPLAKKARTTRSVAVVGYPAFDSRIPDSALMERIYGGTYNKKRLAPGSVTRLEPLRILHDCTTLGGNSGSVLLDLETGEALGLHYSGTFLATNYAVRADVVARLLSDVRSGRARPEARKHPPAPSTVMGVAAGPATASSVNGMNSASVTIPLTVTVTLGDMRPTVMRATVNLPPDDGSDAIPGEEARVEDYRDREGYRDMFLGSQMAVPLPVVRTHADDILTYDNGGRQDTVLRYEHYSVMMSRSRRMCFFSAVNIDGNRSKKSARVGWKWDPRIPREQQIMNECYGSPPKFSRGHMTRREDPGWGDAETARRGNEDSMHVTNTTPQMQAFNAPIWLALEDYALQHAREDDMKISVFTGAYFAHTDPVMYGVRIPRCFWKVIAFIHDETGRLCATGYEMSQVQFLQPQDEFVFGQFQSPQLGIATQVSIASIERKAGISFGNLSAVDPLAAQEEAVGGTRGAFAPLQTLEQIRFVG